MSTSLKDTNMGYGFSRIPTKNSSNVIVLFPVPIEGTGGGCELKRVQESKTSRYLIQPRIAVVLKFGDNRHSLESPDVRTPAQHLENIRKVLNPPIADLASLFDVSRQAIYKWLAGGSKPEPDKLGQITQLSLIADQFSKADISHAGSLLMIKAFEGQSLMDLLKSGVCPDSHIESLINEAKAMEDAYRRSGLAHSKATPTDDWKASLSIPAYPEE